MSGADSGDDSGLGQGDQIIVGQTALRTDGFYSTRKPIVAGSKPLASISATPTDP